MLNTAIVTGAGMTGYGMGLAGKVPSAFEDSGMCVLLDSVDAGCVSRWVRDREQVLRVKAMIVSDRE